jgi:hypothetical protein
MRSGPALPVSLSAPTESNQQAERSADGYGNDRPAEDTSRGADGTRKKIHGKSRRAAHQNAEHRS